MRAWILFRHWQSWEPYWKSDLIVETYIIGWLTHIYLFDTGLSNQNCLISIKTELTILFSNQAQFMTSKPVYRNKPGFKTEFTVTISVYRIIEQITFHRHTPSLVFSIHQCLISRKLTAFSTYPSKLIENLNLSAWCFPCLVTRASLSYSQGCETIFFMKQQRIHVFMLTSKC